MTPTLLRRIKAYDDQRPEIPGEHWVALAAGIALFVWTRRSPSMVVTFLGSTVASMLVVRAATGRYGLEQTLPLLRSDKAPGPRDPVVKQPLA